MTEWASGTSAFAIALLVILVWAVTGPFFHYSDTWQLVINTGTTMVPVFPPPLRDDAPESAPPREGDPRSSEPERLPSA